MYVINNKKFTSMVKFTVLHLLIAILTTAGANKCPCLSIGFILEFINL